MYLAERSVKKLSVVCSKVMARESMRPNKLERHLTSSHAQFVNEPRYFFLGT